MKRRDVESTEMGMQVRSRRARASRHHLELVSSEEEWPDDLFPLLQMARDGMLANEAPLPTPEVLAFLEEPAHGKVDGEGMLLRPFEVEPIELAPLEVEHRHRPRRALVAAGGAAAAIALVVLGLRPTFTGGQTTITSARTSAPAVVPAPTTAATSSAAPEPVTSTASGTSVEPVPVVIAGPEVTAVPPAATDTTVAPASTAPPTTAKASSTTKPRTKTPSGTRAPATTVPAPATPSAADQVLAYYDASNNRGRCVARQPSKSSQAQLVAACGTAPTPPAILLQYWAARDTWEACADPLTEKGYGQNRVTSACGLEPQRSDFGVPPNPYSKSQG